MIDPSEGMGEESPDTDDLYAQSITGESDQAFVAPMVTLLTAAEKESTAWGKVRAELATQLNSLRNANDARLGPIATAEIRGKIALLKELQGMGTAPVLDNNPGGLGVDLGY